MSDSNGTPTTEIEGKKARRDAFDKKRRGSAIAEETLQKLFGQLPPHSNEAEIALLGSVMLDPSVKPPLHARWSNWMTKLKARQLRLPHPIER